MRHVLRATSIALPDYDRAVHDAKCRRPRLEEGKPHADKTGQGGRKQVFWWTFFMDDPLRKSLQPFRSTSFRRLGLPVPVALCAHHYRFKYALVYNVLTMTRA